MSQEFPRAAEVWTAEARGKAIHDCMILALYENKTIQDDELSARFHALRNESNESLRVFSQHAEEVLKGMPEEQRIGIMLRLTSLWNKPFSD